MIHATLDSVNQEILDERAKQLGMDSEDLMEYYEELLDANFEQDLEDVISENGLDEIQK